MILDNKCVTVEEKRALKQNSMANFIQKNLADFHKSGYLALQIKVENRLLLPFLREKAARIQKTTGKKILIINGAERTVSEVHRVFHLEEKLQLLNIHSFTLTRNQLNLFDPTKLIGFDLLYIHRSRASKNLLQLIQLFKRANKKVFFDIDDLVFDVDVVDQLAFLKKETPTFRLEFLHEMAEMLEVMKQSDLILTPTTFLCQYIEKKYHRKTALLQNHLDQDSLKIGQNIHREKIHQKSAQKDVTIAYFPGTRTHETDFASIEATLLSLLKKHPELRLKIVGHLTLPKSFLGFSSRIRQQKPVAYKNLMNCYRDVDMSLAPLEYGSDFCEAKSELKFIFAAAAGIPSVVTDTQANRAAITSGRNGFLCRNNHDWYQALETLIVDEKFRQKMGQAAFDFCQQIYTPSFQAKKLKKILQDYANF